MRWPNELPVNVESMPSVGQYSADQVLAHLDQYDNQGQIGTGRYVFKKRIALLAIGFEGRSIVWTGLDESRQPLFRDVKFLKLLSIHQK